MAGKTPWDFIPDGQRADAHRLSSEKMRHFTGRNPEGYKAASTAFDSIMGPAKEAHAKWAAANPEPAPGPAPAPAYTPAPKRARPEPQYPAGLNPVQFEGHLYHGTRSTLKLNQIMTPETAAQHRTFAESDTSHLFAADTPQKAAHFAKMGSQFRGEPKVYRVEPLGHVGRDEFEAEEGENADLGKSYQAGGFRVVSRYSGKHAPMRYE